jgi:2-polyprenyl-6-hydroxyphenyl methylase/3-demethylubiquinone-9 3-methyltransferase
MTNAAPSLDPEEVEKFARIADQWWAPDGPFAPLHRMNPKRIEVIRDAILTHFGRPQGGRRALAGLEIVDVGCGGGLVTEPMARLGGQVTGLDAAEETIKAAKAHAAGQGLAITYRQGFAEDLAAERPASFDVVLALEIIEHVADVAVFLSAVSALAKPGGLVVLSTINRTPQARALAIFAAEKVLRWLPEGSHHYEKLITPVELSAALESAGLEPSPAIGLAFNPLTRIWSAGDDVAMNYIMTARKPAGRAPG